MYKYQKGDYESMKANTLKFAKEKYFSGYSGTRSVQETFNLITSFIQDLADKHIPSKTTLLKDAKLQYISLAPCCQIYRVTEEV